MLESMIRKLGTWGPRGLVWWGGTSWGSCTLRASVPSLEGFEKLRVSPWSGGGVPCAGGSSEGRRRQHPGEGGGSGLLQGPGCLQALRAQVGCSQQGASA